MPKQMKPEAQQIAIAEACGWIGPFHELDDNVFAIHPAWKESVGITGSPVQHIVPDYPNDLNACYQMEETLTDDQQCQYFGALLVICNRPPTTNMFHASANQRCEAFVQCLKKLWTRSASTLNHPINLE